MASLRSQQVCRIVADRAAPLLMASVGVGTDLIDIKKTGTFPIVHGIRTLSIERGISVTATGKRVDALVADGVLGAELGRELVSALYYFMEIWLRSQLRAVIDRSARNGGDRAPERALDLRPRPPAQRAAGGEAVPRGDPPPL